MQERKKVDSFKRFFRRSFYTVSKPGIVSYFKYHPNDRILSIYPPCHVSQWKQPKEAEPTRPPPICFQGTQVHVRHPHLMTPPTPKIYQSLRFKPKTKGGRALLKQWMCFPLMDPSARLDTVEYYVQRPETLQRVRKILQKGVSKHPIGEVYKMLETAVLVGAKTCMPLLLHFRKYLTKEGTLRPDATQEYLLIHHKEEAVLKQAKKQVNQLVISEDGFYGYAKKKYRLKTGESITKRRKSHNYVTTSVLRVLWNDYVLLRQEKEDCSRSLLQELNKIAVKYPIDSIYQRLCELDILTTFAEFGGVRAEIGPRIQCRGLIHPLVPNCVPNDVDVKDPMILTGDTESGKSTLMKSVAVALYLNQIGCFVPAQYARLPLVDAIHWVDSEEGINQSTFQTHCRNLAKVQRESTPNSFTAIDEICASTAASQGQALGDKVLNHIKGFMMVSTHYRFPERKQIHLNGYRLQAGPAPPQEPGGLPSDVMYYASLWDTK